MLREFTTNAKVEIEKNHSQIGTRTAQIFWRVRQLSCSPRQPLKSLKEILFVKTSLRKSEKLSAPTMDRQRLDCCPEIRN